jgi:hypothetical protein
MVDIEDLVRKLGDPDPKVRFKAVWVLWDAAFKGMDVTAAIPALAKALSDTATDVQCYAALALGNAAFKEADVTAAIPALAKALSDWHAGVREIAANALTNSIEKSTSVEALERMETRLREEHAIFRDKHHPRTKDELAGIGLAFSKLINETAKRRDLLATQRDIMLEGVPKAPKKGGVYQEMRRVRNG